MGRKSPHTPQPSSPPRRAAKRANPQGKGLVPLLQNLEQRLWRRPPPPKQIAQIELELFTALFVLQGEPRFSPVPGRVYHLYQHDVGYRMLLVAPAEWHRPYPHRYIGACVLQDDGTWTLELDAAVAADAAFMAHITELQERLRRHLERAQKIEDALPTYIEGLSYHARVLAFVAGSSLSLSLRRAGLAELDYRAAKGLLGSGSRDGD